MNKIAKRGDKVIVTTERGDLLCVVVGPQTKSTSGLEELMVVVEHDGEKPRWVALDTVHLPVEQLTFTDGTAPARIEDDGLVVPQNEGDERALDSFTAPAGSTGLEDSSHPFELSSGFASAAPFLEQPCWCGKPRGNLIHGKPNVVDEDWQPKFVPVVTTDSSCPDCGALPATEHANRCAYFIVAMMNSVASERRLTEAESIECGWAERVIEALECPPSAPEPVSGELAEARWTEAARYWSRETIRLLGRHYGNAFCLDVPWHLDSAAIEELVSEMQNYKLPPL